MTNKILNISYLDFIELYPEFSAMTESQYNNYVIEARIILSKYCIINDTVLTVVIYKAVAHLYQLSLNKTVGRVSTGTQGNTSVNLEYNMTGKTGSWWNQTPYGAFIYANIILPKCLGGRYAI